MKVKVGWESEDHFVVFLSINNAFKLGNLEFSPDFKTLVE